ncbi:MAG: membrane protein insertion efficiency factor YidD [Candidatus Rokuibacteriota bacterium]|nr:MAG: membrane protein insertion efficiency factor YidD [Candidatus Rokubacteria bacterium]
MNPAARAALLGITAYQWAVSPLLPRTCRFAPSCSEYARRAITEHGLLRGGGLALRRLLRCHPFHPGGIDPPPPAPSRGKA